MPQPVSSASAAAKSEPTVGVIYNPRSPRNQGQDLDSDPAPHVFISQPGDRQQLPVALKRFAERGIDLLVINGGDGTVRDVLAVGVTTLWTMLQAMLGSASNKWRRGSAMDITIARGGKSTPMPHSGRGDAGWRQFLFASTLETFPAGLVPFAAHKHGLKLAVLDQASRRTILRIPMIMTGRDSHDHSTRGIHQLACDSFTLTLEDDFILDGEAYSGGTYRIESGPPLEFVKPA